MKEIKTTADIANATAIDLGPLAEIKDYVLELGPGVKIPGKVFGGAAIKAGGADFSLQVFAPGTEGGFYHTHKEHEELYFFLSGEGEYQVDGTNISFRAKANIRSTARTSPSGKVLSCASRPQAGAPSATPARRRSRCSVSSMSQPRPEASMHPTVRFFQSR